MTQTSTKFPTQVYALLEGVEHVEDSIKLIFDCIPITSHERFAESKNFDDLDCSQISVDFSPYRDEYGCQDIPIQTRGYFIYHRGLRDFRQIQFSKNHWFLLTLNYGLTHLIYNSFSNGVMYDDSEEESIEVEIYDAKMLLSCNHMAKELNATYSLSMFESSLCNKERIIDLITKATNNVEDFTVCVRNVGQGSCNSFHPIIQDSQDYISKKEFLYLACGGGINANKHTYPSNVSFSPQENALHILCHWDKDHWVSASRHEELVKKVNWIVPLQSPIGASHLKLANILYRNKRLNIWPQELDNIKSSFLDIYKLPQHKDRNLSGLVTITKTSFKSQKNFFYSGDAPFIRCKGFIEDYKLAAIAIPHHGGEMPFKDIPHAPKSHVAVCSYGQGNTYNHPFSKKPRTSTQSRYAKKKWTSWQDTTADDKYIYGGSTCPNYTLLLAKLSKNLTVTILDL